MADQLVEGECSHSFDLRLIKKYQDPEEQDEDSKDDYSDIVIEDQDPRLAMTLEMAQVEKLYNLVKSGKGTVTPKVFAGVLREHSNIEHELAIRLFQKIDWSSMASVSWSEFCTYLQMEFNIRFEHELAMKEVHFHLPALTIEYPHRDNAVSVHPLADGMWVTVSSEAHVCLWTPKGNLKRTRHCLSKPRMKRKLPRQWITASALMNEYSKIILCTGDREIQFYDMASFSPFCQLSGLESIPICFDYKPICRNKCIMVYGDQMGCINVLNFHFIGKSFRMWKKLHKHEDYIPSMPVEMAIQDPSQLSFMRWKVHNEWVNMVRYYPETDNILSCSKDPVASCVIGHRRGSCNVPRAMREWDQMVARKQPLGLYGCTKPRLHQDQIVYSLSRGVHVFDFSKELSMVATGGADRVITLWSCFLSKKSLAKMWGHYDMIRSLTLCHRTKRLYSVSDDLWVKVWDVQDYACLYTMSRLVHMVRGPLEAVAFNFKTFIMALAGDQLGLLKIMCDDCDGYYRSHDAPLSCLLSNEKFHHILSADESSVIKTWHLDSGRQEGFFRDAHGEYGIADMTFDGTGRRLITVGRDGSGYVWNYNIGIRVRAITKLNGPATAMTYVDMHNKKYIIVAGWNKRMNMYIDDTPETIPFEIAQIPLWRDDKVRGHLEDILTIDFSGRSQIATGSFDGNVFVWNMETSSKSHHIAIPQPEGWSQEKAEEDKGVSVVHFLKARSKNRRGGNIVVGGPFGHVSIWCTSFARTPNPYLAYFPVYPEEETEVFSCTCIDSDKEDNILATGDSKGHVTVWDISNYAMDMNDQERLPPARIGVWEGHLKSVTGIKVVKGRRFVVSASEDCTVRMWSTCGHFVGTFGQPSLWDLDNELTFQHPNLPKDIVDYYLDRQPEVETEEEEEEEEITDEMMMTEWQLEHFKIGLDYFDRHKAVLSKKGRHLNDEQMWPYSGIGTVTPYRTVRHHGLQSPPQLPDKAAVEAHFKEAEEAQYKLRESETSLIPQGAKR